VPVKFQLEKNQPSAADNCHDPRRVVMHCHFAFILFLTRSELTLQTVPAFDYIRRCFDATPEKQKPSILKSLFS
jgi:hypothetical protein